MSDFQDQLNHVVQRFVTQITGLAQRAAVDTLESAFGGPAGHANGAGARAATAGKATIGRLRDGRGAKRTAEELEELATKCAVFVKANPGLRIDQINKELGTTTKELALPIRKLISNRMITGKGQRRAMKYFPGRRA